jgi:uncharacterized protein (TIGR02145 family)
VWWNAGSRDATHLSKVWVWVDYITVNSNNTTLGNSWTRAAVSAASPAASVTYDGSNRQGFWLQGDSGSYSATVTVQLNITASKFNWCAYVSDYPPNVTVANGTYTFRGTPPFILIASNGITSQTVTGTTLAASALTITPTTIMDETACPAVFCPYQGSDLYMNTTYLCQQRSSGAKNWEAYIKDARDNELYRIVLMPDNKWWLAQNVKLASYNSTTVGSVISGCTKEECGRAYTWEQIYASYAGGTSGSTGNVQGICPPGWLLPTRLTYAALAGSFNSSAEFVTALRSYNSRCLPKPDLLGWASQIGVHNSTVYTDQCSWYSNDNGREDGTVLDEAVWLEYVCGEWNDQNDGDLGTMGVVRCYYQL